jgi:hypothetical protein
VLTIALAGRRGLDLAHRRQPQRAVTVDGDGDAERRGHAGDHHAEQPGLDRSMPDTAEQHGPSGAVSLPDM